MNISYFHFINKKCNPKQTDVRIIINKQEIHFFLNFFSDFSRKSHICNMNNIICLCKNHFTKNMTSVIFFFFPEMTYDELMCAYVTC